MVFTSFETVTEKQNLTKENDTSTTATEEMPDTGKTGTMRSSVCLKKKKKENQDLYLTNTLLFPLDPAPENRHHYYALIPVFALLIAPVFLMLFKNSELNSITFLI